MTISKHQWNDFEALWALEATQVEEGNDKETGGHSHVVHFMTSDPEPAHVYMKKQFNYSTRWSRLIGKPRSVCCREYDNIAAWKKLGIPTLDALHCAERYNPLRAILITAALDGYLPLNEYLLTVAEEKRVHVLQGVGRLLHRIHAAHWAYRCCYPKHLFVSVATAEIKIIDLEKARRSWTWMYDHLRDLSAFDRRMVWRSKAERQAFFDAYFERTSGLYRQLTMYCLGRMNVRKNLYNGHQSPELP